MSTVLVIDEGEVGAVEAPAAADDGARFSASSSSSLMTEAVSASVVTFVCAAGDVTDGAGFGRGGT